MVGKQRVMSRNKLLSDVAYAALKAKDKDVEKLRLEVLEEIAEIKKGNFPPNPTELCKYCDFRDICQWRLK